MCNITYPFLFVRISTSCSDKPFIVGDIAHNFGILLSTIILTMAILGLFLIHVAKLTVYDRLYVVNKKFSYFLAAFNEAMCVYVYTN